MMPLYSSPDLYHLVKIPNDFYHGIWPDIKLYHILILRNECIILHKAYHTKAT